MQSSQAVKWENDFFIWHADALVEMRENTVVAERLKRWRAASNMATRLSGIRRVAEDRGLAGGISAATLHIF